MSEPSHQNQHVQDKPNHQPKQSQTPPIVTKPAPTQSKPQKTKPKTVIVQRKRIFRGNVKIHHDLFKLEVSIMKKNVAWDGTLELVSVEHCHFFHTVDSDGNKQIYSSTIGGHFHDMEVIHTDEGVPLVKCVSGPKQIAKKKNRDTGKYQKVTIPVNNWDNHTHGIIYLNSHEVTKRKANVEAIKIQTIEAQKIAPIPGVTG